MPVTTTRRTVSLARFPDYYIQPRASERRGHRSVRSFTSPHANPARPKPFARCSSGIKSFTPHAGGRLAFERGDRRRLFFYAPIFLSPHCILHLYVYNNTTSPDTQPRARDGQTRQSVCSSFTSPQANPSDVARVAVLLF